MEMLEKNPKKRITAEQILRHEFFVHPYDLNDSDSEYIGLEGKMRKINLLFLLFSKELKNFLGNKFLCNI